MDWLSDLFSQAQQALFESVVQPLAFALGQGNLLDQAYEGTGWLLAGLLQIAVLVALIGPLQRWRPIEPITDRRAVRVDVIYTLIHRLGLFKLVMFFTFENWLEQGIAVLRGQGLPTLHLDQLWPGVTDHGLVSFLIYLVVFDFINYWLHRGQHSFEWWWRLHALHHAQRQVTMWTDNRNHLLDSILTDLIFVLLAILIGVPPGQFVALVAFSQLSESLQHANVRLSFGRIGERLWVSPRFHRLHHAIGLGHETPPAGEVRGKAGMSAAGPSQGAKAPSGGSGPREAGSVGAPRTKEVLGGCNFGVLFPWWDMLFGTANFAPRWEPTGVRDQVEQGRDYGDGFWSQQWLGLKRLVGRA
ncbi:sterol desaturase family protein [Tibeticola sp.]|uniref:sterol desaturase family protein n=1 Tax=Tibeticola sp. TaxID=2005368 RepID=UPI0025E0B29F|nr:sterol desaturase family protein [Tibeticola sp.]